MASGLRMRRQLGAGGIRDEKRRIMRKAGLPATPAERPEPRRARALFDFAAQREGDLSLKAGQTLVLLEAEGEWWRGHAEGAEPETAGVFPHNHVEEIKAEKVRMGRQSAGGAFGPLTGPKTQFATELEGAIMADQCCRGLRNFVSVALVLVLGAWLGTAWTLSGSTIAQFPLTAFRWRYANLGRWSAAPELSSWDRPQDTRALFGHMYNSTPLVIRQGYGIHDEELSWLLDDAKIAERLGADTNLTVETRPKGSKQFGYGSVGYADMSVADFLAHRGGDELAGLDAAGVSEPLELYLVQQAVEPPAWFDERLMTIESTNLWMSGNADGGEVSNCHFDMSDNLQVVVEGSKTLTLIPPADTPFLYPVQPADGLGAFESAYSGIEDLSAGSGEEETLRQYPKLAQAKRISVTLNAGDVLFIPRLWWHQVSSSVGTPATSVNFWFRNAYSFSDLLAREMIRLNYDLYLEKRAHTLRHTRWQRFLDEASRIALGPEPVPPMNVMYSHNPADLEDGNGAAGTVGLTLADKAKEAEWSTGVAVPITAKGGACERKGFLFSYEEMGPRVESGAEGGSFDWDDEGAPAALEGRGGSNGAKSGLGKLSARMRARFEEAMDRSASLRASGRLEASLVYLQRAVSVLPEHFDARWQHSAVLMDLDRTEAALRQLRCAVPTVPARRLQEFFVRYLWLLYKLERHSVAQQLMPVAARYVPLLPPWVLPTQLTHGPYLPSAEDGQPVPYHDEWCEASGVCGTVSAAVPELKDELQGLLEALNETEFGVVDAFVPTPAEEQRAKPFGQGGDLVLLDQESGVVNATACAMLPKHCALLRSLPLAFQRMEDPDSRYGWRGVPAQASVRFVNPWSRSTALLTQESNDMLMMFAPIIVPKTPTQPAPWTVIGGEKVLMREGVPLVFDPAFFFSAFSPMKQPMFMLVVSFFKPPLCAMRRCALTAEEMLPPALRDDFTQGGTIPVIDWVLGRAQTMDEAAALDEGHGGADEQQAVVWSEALVEAHIAAFAPAAVTHRAYNAHAELWSERAKASGMVPGGQWNCFQQPAADSASVSLHGDLDPAGLVPPEHYPGAALLHVTAFTKHPVLSGAAVAVLGSITPWIEAIAHHFDAATITTVEHNVPDCAHDRISTQHFDQFRDKASAGSYDAVVSYSSVEHAGLGRYGDPLDPSGDFRAMAAVHAALKPNGTLFWGAPVGQDGLMWNAMRIYGRRRLPRLLEGFEVVEWFGHEEAVLDTAPAWQWTNQPVVVLRKVAK